MTKIRDLIKRFEDLSAIGTANIVGTAISALFWLYLASFIETEDYGEISYLLAIAGIGTAVALLGGGGTIVVYSAKKIPIESTVFFLSIIASIVVSIILFFVVWNVNVSIYVLGYIIFGLATANLLGLKLYKTYSKYYILQRVLFVTFSLPLYYLVGPHGIVLGVALSFFPPIGIIYRRFKDSRINFNLLKPRLGFMLSNYAKDLARVFSAQLDKLIIVPLFSFSILGNYYLGIQFLSLLSLIPSIVFQYTIAQDASGNPRKKLKQVTVLVSIGSAILGVTIAPIIMPMIFPKFENAGEIIQIMSLAIIPRAVSMMFMSKFLGLEKGKIVVIGTGIFLLVQIPLIFVLGDIVGVNGVAWALVSAEIAMMSFFLISNRYTSESFSKTNSLT